MIVRAPRAATDLIGVHYLIGSQALPLVWQRGFDLTFYPFDRQQVRLVMPATAPGSNLTNCESVVEDVSATALTTLEQSWDVTGYGSEWARSETEHGDESNCVVVFILKRRPHGFILSHLVPCFNL